MVPVPFLPIAGGTLTGALSGTTISLTGGITLGDLITVMSNVSGGRIAYFKSTATTNQNTQFVLDAQTNFNPGIVFEENAVDKIGLFYNSNTTSGNRQADTFELYSFVSGQPVIRVHQSAGNTLNIASDGSTTFTGRVTATAYTITAASTAPGNTTTPAAWMAITAGSTVYKLPLYT